MINQVHTQQLALLQETCPQLYNPRIQGTIAAWEVTTDDMTTINARLKQMFLAAGLLLRPLGNTVYLLPPYCITSQQLEESYQKIGQILQMLKY